MCNKIVLIMPALLYLCGCQSSDPYVHRSEMRKESKQIAQAQTSLAMTALDEKYRANIDRLASAADRNAESISTLESKLDAVAAQDAKSLSQLKSGLQADIGQNSSSTKQNAESIALLESTVNSLIKQTGQSVADIRSDLEQLEEQVAQFRLDVHQEFAREEADRTETTDQLAEKTDQLADKVNQLVNRPQKVFLSPAEPRRHEDTPTILGNTGAQPTYYAAPPTKTEQKAYCRQDAYQVCFAAIGPLVMVSGPLVAELYARKQKRLAHSLTRNVVQIPTK
jgi:X-X-X-Leu-X-X-Gly heptad repeat protein